MREWVNVVHTLWRLNPRSPASLTAIALSCFQIFPGRRALRVFSSYLIEWIWQTVKMLAPLKIYQFIRVTRGSPDRLLEHLCISRAELMTTHSKAQSWFSFNSIKHVWEL